MAPGLYPASAWHDRLDAARSVADVVDICQAFMAQYPAAKLEELPGGCRPPDRLDATVISRYAVDLVRMDLDAGEPDDSVLKAFVLFFTDAAQAIARIAMARARRDGWAYVAVRR
jgi:hypothetical protein